MAMAIFRAAANLHQEVGGVEQPTSFGGRNGSINAEETGGGNQFDFRHWVAKGKVPIFVDPPGKGLEVRKHAVDSTVIPAPGILS